MHGMHVDMYVDVAGAGEEKWSWRSYMTYDDEAPSGVFDLGTPVGRMART